ncbi:hypothetical protein [Lysinibacillus fusiformis]|uniref:hypothetical protein n=1 Tax=Lysinibacillus fusiformis TaxID=28031 RepID=UPI0021BF938A|nr:hypothetical protein [Lysinibacillus fusiformis]UXJ71357.1 hypothetical protein N5069_24270 [Lysinibacillus fusiformis]
MVKNFVYGVNTDGYIYGRLFKSAGNNGKFVIDTGGKEINADNFKIEVWNGEKYIPTTANESIVNTNFYGGYARIKEQMII